MIWTLYFDGKEENGTISDQVHFVTRTEAMPKRRRSSSFASRKEAPVQEKEEDLLPEVSQEEEEAGEVENSGSEEERTLDTSELPATLVGASSDEEEIALDEITVGDVPMHWYDEYEHIGYNIEGEKIARPARKDQLDAFLDREDKTHWYAALFFLPCTTFLYPWGEQETRVGREEPT